MARPRDAPERSRRAQGVQHALLAAGHVPYAAAHSSASSTSPPAIGAERDASAGRCGAVWGYSGTHPGDLGVHNARDTPSPKPAACPAQRCTAGPARPHRLRSVRTATRRPGGAGRCGAVVLSHRVWWRPSAKGTHEPAQAAHVPRAAAPPMALRHEPAGEDERPERRPASVERVTHRDGAAASPTAARTARCRPEPERPSATARCWYLCRGVIK